MKYTFSTHSYDLEDVNEMYKWCMENLYHGGYYEPNWDLNLVDNAFTFTDEREFMWFKLRWT